MAAPARVAIKQAVDKTSLLYKFKKWYYYKSYFPQIGLRKDDTITETPYNAAIIKEALRRIPKEEFAAREFRIIRANQLSLMKTILPKEEWTVFEEDDHYLLPHIEEVEREMKEKKEWDSL